MASNLSTIGFGYPTEAELLAVIGPLAENATQRLAVPAGDYGIWRSRAGMELWFHILGERSGDGEITDGDAIGLTPFFAGESEVAVQVDRVFQRDADNPFEGAMHAWVMTAGADPETEGSSESLYPLVFNLVDFAAHQDRPLPWEATCRLTGFARDLKFYADEAQFEAAQANAHRFAVKSFVPIGIFEALSRKTGSLEPPPSSHALINGIVREQRIVTNEVSGQAMLWLQVDSHAAAFDVIADPALVDGVIPEGAIVSAGCLLMGRVA